MQTWPKMTYRVDWDLESIPPAAIPDELLRSWWASRNARLKKKEDVPPVQREWLDKKAASMRRLRAARAEQPEA